ncbi:MAG: type I-G CRISPR-associated helicase/endonuclease Cas3g, partial [Actinomycetota bacterium]
MVRHACGHDPFGYQVRVGVEGLPELLKVPTGAGKTLAAALGWLFRRRFHPDPAVRASTPRWLAFVLPMRVLVEQTTEVIGGWLAAAGVRDEIGLHVVMGGEGRVESRWRAEPEKDAIFVGTVDMLISRALNRGYGANRFRWPVDFGLFNSGVQWVFDEVQLLGPALPTSCQLEGLRRKLGTALPSRSMWMSATVDAAWLATPDLPSIGSTVELDAADRSGPLQSRLEAAKSVRQVHLPRDAGYARKLAQELVSRHRAGTLTIAVLNTVERSKDVFRHLSKASPAPIVLLHSRFRPAERAAHVSAALGPVDPSGPGRIVVSTQVLEAGVDISATTLFTEAAPWPSIVQRAGRCNRYGRSADAVLLWARPPKAAPYDEADVEAAASALDGLEGRDIRPGDVDALRVPVSSPQHPVLRRRDLLGLFDTAPDLSGNDLDVGRYIRTIDDLDVQVAWREVPDTGPTDDDQVPTRRELCPVPVGQVRQVLRAGRRAWRFDHLAESWVRCGEADLRPGLLLVLRSQDGGYDPTTGWDIASKGPVAVAAPEEPSPVSAAGEATGADPVTYVPGVWMPLRRHLEEVESAVAGLLKALEPPGLSPEKLEAAIVAGRLHDVGKA